MTGAEDQPLRLFVPAPPYSPAIPRILQCERVTAQNQTGSRLRKIERLRWGDIRERVPF